jgi:hypothetical protein
MIAAVNIGLSPARRLCLTQRRISWMSNGALKRSTIGKLATETVARKR